MLLKSDLAQHQDVPKEYNLDITEPQVNNTYVFTEQDLPGYASKNKAKADAIKAGIPAYLMKSKNEKETSNQSWERRKKGGVPPRKSIPKKTAIAGRIRHELAGVALDNIESETMMKRETEEGMRPKAFTQIVDARAINPSAILQSGTQAAHDAFDGFIVRIPCLILRLAPVDTFTENGSQDREEEDGEQGNENTAERAARPALGVLRSVQLLVDEVVAAEAESARGIPARDVGGDCHADPDRQLCESVLPHPVA